MGYTLSVIGNVYKMQRFRNLTPILRVYSRNFAFIRKSFALCCVSNAFICGSFAFTRKIFAFIRKNLAFIRKSLAFYRESLALIRELVLYFLNYASGKHNILTIL